MQLCAFIAGKFDHFECRDLFDASRVGYRLCWGALNLGLETTVRTARIVDPNFCQ
jgi:hypothetical protein